MFVHGSFHGDLSLQPFGYQPRSLTTRLHHNLLKTVQEKSTRPILCKQLNTNLKFKASYGDACKRKRERKEGGGLGGTPVAIFAI